MKKSILILATCFAMTASAATIDIYDNFTDFDTAVSTTISTETFDAGLGIVTATPAGANNITFPGSSLFQDVIYPTTHTGPDNPNHDPNSSTTFGWTGGNFGSFGFDFNLNPGNFGTGLILDVIFAVGPESTGVFSIGEFDPQTGFFGLVSDMEITGFRLRALDSNSEFIETYQLDNVRFATLASTPSEIPEPATFGLAGLALLGLGLARRRSA